MISRGAVRRHQLGFFLPGARGRVVAEDVGRSGAGTPDAVPPGTGADQVAMDVGEHPRAVEGSAILGHELLLEYPVVRAGGVAIDVDRSGVVPQVIVPRGSDRHHLAIESDSVTEAVVGSRVGADDQNILGALSQDRKRQIENQEDPGEYFHDPFLLNKESVTARSVQQPNLNPISWIPPVIRCASPPIRIGPRARPPSPCRHAGRNRREPSGIAVRRRPLPSAPARRTCGTPGAA